VFANVLIANRGEIAVRIIRACRELGIATTAVYSELDRNALHVRLADQAFGLGGRTAAESYLNTEALLDVVARSGADAVHPGYGFYSENAEFARAITSRGVAFIGPRPEAIEVMGDKISARRAAEQAGVESVPGATDPVVDPEQIVAFGDQHGWPVAVKAAYGGGGRGMRIVGDASEAAEALAAAQRESSAFFGRSECYLERYLTHPRHIEVQVLADSHGNCVHLSTRDCSAQRRHQKLIEEAPAPDIPAATAAAIGEAAVAVARGCDYVNAGTVEFLYEAGSGDLDSSAGSFYYLEMNTRLQVEHPATEMITGIDLVEQQLRIAAGEPLTFGQQDIEVNGHSIEVRINAEDPAGGAFLPSPGKIETLRAPDGFGTRFDTGYESGDEISQFYDNLVGKLIVWGRNRERAIARAVRALSEFEITGIATTIDADLAILKHPDFGAVAHSTKWVENSLDLSGIAGGPSAAVADSPAQQRTKRQLEVEVNGKLFNVSMWVPEAAGGISAAQPAGTTRPRRSAGRSAGGAGSGEVTVPMQGTIVKVSVAVGAAVEPGDVIVVLEAMKMENLVVAERAGSVAEVRVSEGDSVGGGDIVAVIA